MFRKFTEKFKGDRKYFSIVFFILILIGVSGIITEKIINDTINNWNDELTPKISNLEESVRKDFNIKQKDLLLKLNNIRTELKRTLQPENEAYKELVKLVNHEKFSDYSVEIFAPNGKLIAWNQLLAINQNELFPLTFPLGEEYFLSNNLLTYLTIVDTVHIQTDIFFITISKPVEKKYKLLNQFYEPISLIHELSMKYQNDFDIDYSPYAEKSKDGRKYSFELINSDDKKIGIVTFTKPTLANAVNNIKDQSSKIQSLLIFIVLMLVGVGLKTDFRKLKSKKIKFILWLIYLSAIRFILFVVGLPSKIITGSLIDPSFFSSAFGFGIVKSPLELLTTNILVVVLGVQFFNYSRQSFFHDKKIKSKTAGIVLSILCSISIFLLIRGISAAIKSVIFDSTIRYFKEPNILPDLPSLVMNLNILLLGFAIVIIIIGHINLISKYLSIDHDNVNKTKLSIMFININIIVFIAFFIAKDPLITPFFLLIFLLLLFLLYYQIILKNKNSVYNYLFALLIGSLISITLLNYFNTKLERESLKTTAIEINRADENFLNFMIDETLRNALAQSNILEGFGNKYEDFDALAFSIWSRSSMQRESMNSGIRFYDKNQNLLGGYQVGLDPDKEIFKYVKDGNEPTIVTLTSKDGESNKYYEGIIEVKEREITKGYITAFVSFDIESIGANNFPDFIKSNLSIFNRVIDVNQLKIFQFINSKLTQVYGDIYPSRDQIKQIVQTKIDSNYNDAWVKLKFEGETYETYLFKVISDKGEMLTTVSVAERAFSWDLFNFFKIFIVHSLFIVLTFFIIVISRLGKINLTFKSKLLFAFLFISIIPVIILAFYNSQIVNERGKEGIFNELSQRADYIEKHLKSQLLKSKRNNLIAACQNASKQLGISFAIYNGTDQIYNSQDLYDQIGFFNRKLNAKIYYFLNYLRYKEYMISENVDNFKYENYYKYINLGGQNYILSVNDAFNKIKITSSTTEINVIIFGIYSFAVIIIIIISTFFANQIAQPIRRLTKATEAVGKGDLNIKIDHNERGEIKDLLDGFNSMTSELKKNQIELAEMEREAAWKEMAKQVAHEIKNPLTPMKLALQQLIISYKDKSHDFDKLFEKLSQTVLNQIENLNQIASEFSRFAKMPSLKIEIVDLVNSLHDTVNMFIHEKTSIDINSELNKAEIEADVSQLRRMFINLIRNSIQAGASKITIHLTQEINKYQIIFIDNGDGIVESHKNKIFDESFTTKKQGMGLGLSLTKRFLESINGEIKLYSTSTNGTTFKITIPVYQETTDNQK